MLSAMQVVLEKRFATPTHLGTTVLRKVLRRRTILLSKSANNAVQRFGGHGSNPKPQHGFGIRGIVGSWECMHSTYNFWNFPDHLLRLRCCSFIAQFPNENSYNFTC